MAPEIIKKEIYNEKVDIWSLGVITYMLLSGQSPFPSSDTARIKKYIVNR
jgi:serine/threonine protein kinase